MALLPEVDESQLQAFVAYATRANVQPAFSEKRLSTTNFVPDHSPPIGSNSALNKRRLSDVIDSLANICVAKAHSEVVAVALKWSRKNKVNTVELLIATNSGVSGIMRDHLLQIWHMMGSLSRRYQDVGPPIMPSHLRNCK